MDFGLVQSVVPSLSNKRKRAISSTEEAADCCFGFMSWFTSSYLPSVDSTQSVATMLFPCVLLLLHL